MAKKRAARKIYQSEDPDDNMPQRKMEDIASVHASQRTGKPLERKAMESLGENEDGKELFNFVLKGMAKPDNQ